MSTWRDAIRTDAFLAAVTARVRTVGVRAEMVDFVGTPVLDVPITGGTVDMRGEQAEQWACTVTLADPALLPQSSADMLDPRSGYRLRIWWRLWGSGAWAELPVFTGPLEDPDIDDDGTLTYSLTGRDALTLARRGGYARQTIALGGLTVTAALQAIFAVVAPFSPLSIGTSTVTLPSTYEVGSRDPAEDWTEIAAMAGWVVRTDREGTIVCGPQPDPSTPSADWQEGEGCKVVRWRRQVKTSGIQNRVVVTSTSPDVDPVIVGIAEDNDEGSSTWVGRYGPFELLIESDAIATQAAADSMAAMHLGRVLYPSESVEVEVPPRPDLEYRDVVQLARRRAGVAGEFRVSGWSLPLGGPGLMSVSMMSRSLR